RNVAPVIHHSSEPIPASHPAHWSHVAAPAITSTAPMAARYTSVRLRGRSATEQAVQPVARPHGQIVDRRIRHGSDSATRGGNQVFDHSDSPMHVLYSACRRRVSPRTRLPPA